MLKRSALLPVKLDELLGNLPGTQLQRGTAVVAFENTEIGQGMKLDDIVGVLESMPSDDVADILGKLHEKKANAILKRMKKEGSEEIEGLLSYEADTAGGIMVPDFIAMREDMTAGQAIESLQKEYMDVEMPFYGDKINLLTSATGSQIAS